MRNWPGDVQGWIDRRLSGSARGAVKRARHEAFDKLRAELQRAPAPAATLALGLPPVHQAIVLLDRLASVSGSWGTTNG
jgi:hypothetical protein